MDRSTKCLSVTRGDGLIVRTHWSAGLRTPAWDRLWRAILSDLGPRPSDGLDEQIESEGNDA